MALNHKRLTVFEINILEDSDHIPKRTSRRKMTDQPKSHSLIPPHGGYQDLKSYQMSEIVYDATVVFCERFIDKRLRMQDQMVQAGRRGKQNIVEGSRASGTSEKTKLKLIGVARASLEELLLDYHDILRQKGLRAWIEDDPRTKLARALAWKENRSYSTYRTYFGNYNSETAANTAICVNHQDNYPLDQLLRVLEKQFVEEGEFTKRQRRVCLQARGSSNKL